MSGADLGRTPYWLGESEPSLSRKVVEGAVGGIMVMFGVAVVVTFLIGLWEAL